jgi:hypothetical protein
LNYLLSSQTLLDLCAEDVNAAQQWSRAIPAESLRISVISWAQAASEIASLDDADVRRTVESVFAALLNHILADAGPEGLLGFERNHADQWRGLMFDTRLGGISQIDRQVYATAIAEGLTVVEERHDMTEVLQQLGLRIAIPGE